MIILVFLMLIIVITTCYFAKVKTDQAENMSNYRRSSRPLDSDNDTDRNERRLRRRNPSGGTLRSGSNSSSERRHGHQRSSSNQGENPSNRKDEFLPRERGHSRRLSGGNSRQVTDTLSKSNLDRLSRQANSVKQSAVKNLSDSHNKHGSEKRREGEPALVFVED
jgi:hypothetical protein